MSGYLPIRGPRALGRGVAALRVMASPSGRRAAGAMPWLPLVRTLGRVAAFAAAIAGATVAFLCFTALAGIGIAAVLSATP